MLSAIVLAAGLSKRMGTQNKLLLPYKGITVIETTLRNIIAAGLKEVIVITGYEHEKITATISTYPVTVAFNTAYDTGMTSSIQQAVAQATGTGYMICLADMLLITAEEYTLLHKGFEKALAQNEKCICIPQYNGIKGNPVIFSSFYRNTIMTHTDTEGCREIVQQSKEHVSFIDMSSPHILQDLDTPEDYTRLIKEVQIIKHTQ